MICLLRWTAFLWTVNSIPGTFGMAVSEHTGMCAGCPQFFVQQLISLGNGVEYVYSIYIYISIKVLAVVLFIKCQHKADKYYLQNQFSAIKLEEKNKQTDRF